MRMLFTGLCFAFNLLVCSAKNPTPPSVLNISFGKGNAIIYNLKKGTFSLSFSGNAAIRDAYALSKGTSIINDSRKFTFDRTETSAVADAFGKGKKYTIYRKGANGLQMRQLFWVYDGKNYFFTRLVLSGTNAASNYSSPLVSGQLTFNKEGDNRALSVPFDNDSWVRYDAHELPDSKFTSSEVSAIYNSNNYNGIVIGSIEHEVWKTGIRIDAGKTGPISLSAFGGFTDSVITHDKKEHGFVLDEKNNSESPRIMVGYFEDWRKGMEIYGENNRMAEPPVIFDWKDATPMGWNSWGALQDKLTLEHAEGVVDFLHDSCPAFRNGDNTLFIDLDSYWNEMLPAGMDGDLGKLRSFVAYCKTRGFKPGIYWTPFIDWGKFERKVEGSDYNYAECWTRVNGTTIEVDGGRAVDPTHPAIRKRIDYYIDKLKVLGFKMIKIDFLGHGALEADSYYDRKVHTGMQAYRAGMEYVAHKLGDSMLVYAAISPNMATARYVHIRRIACDAFKRIDESAYTLNSTTYGWWLSRMYNFLDADHVVFGDAGDGENRARLASAVVTGSLITGDDYSSDGKWKDRARTLLQNQQVLALIGHDGKSFTPVEVNTGKNPGRIFTKVIGNKLYIAVLNYSDTAVKINDLPSLLAKSHLSIGGTLKDLFDPSGNEVSASAISVPAKDAAIYESGITN